MYKLFTSTPIEFKKHCIVLNTNKQEELNMLVDLRDKYITHISSKRKDYEEQYAEYLRQSSDNNDYIDRVNLFRTLSFKKPEFDIYTYKNYFELKELNED
jgi:hypothetical protein